MDVNNTLSGFNSMASTFAADVDQAFWINFWISIVLGLSVIIPLFYFAWKYRESNVKDEDIINYTHNTPLEITWTLVPTALMMVLFYYGYTSMKTLRTMPAESESIVIKLEGSKWMWKYEYPANKAGHVHKITSIYDAKIKGVKRGLYVPKGQKVILKMTAPIDDVIHAYYVPAFRMKEDVVPGRMTQQWFQADVVGKYEVECAEYCGTKHSYMYSEIIVMEQADYDKWFESDAKSPFEDQNAAPMSKGESLFVDNGCAGCHSVADASTIVGPSLMGITSTKDAQYLKDAILNPNKDIAEGFSPVMPATKMSDEDMKELYAYIATAAVAKGANIIEENGCTACHTNDGSASAGPSFKGMRTLEDAYIKDAILTPNKDIAEGFTPMMPASKMSDEDIAEVTKYLKAL
ncbi:MAG: cytochrome c oxidase subunit II [Sulfurovum sp.]|nr:cytochrome c oxidase subunit II [Sulfurovum sp.]